MFIIWIRCQIKEIQERLGHKDVKNTMNIYAHVTPEKVKETGEHFAQYVKFLTNGIQYDIHCSIITKQKNPKRHHINVSGTH